MILFQSFSPLRICSLRRLLSSSCVCVCLSLVLCMCDTYDNIHGHFEVLAFGSLLEVWYFFGPRTPPWSWFPQGVRVCVCVCVCVCVFVFFSPFSCRFEELRYHRHLQCLLYVSWTSIMGNNLVIYFLFYFFPVCEGFRVLDWKKKLVFTFCNACCIYLGLQLWGIIT